MNNPRSLGRLSFPVSLLILEVVFDSSLKPLIGGTLAILGMLVWLGVFLFGGVPKYPAAFRGFVDDLTSSCVRAPLLAAHFAALVLLAWVTRIIVHSRGQSDFPPAASIKIVWYLTLLAAAALGAMAFLRLRTVVDLFHRTGLLWLYATAAAIVAMWVACKPAFYNLESAIWLFATRTTFALVRLMLRPLVAHVIANPATARLGTERFSATISVTCSGIEGVATMLVFSATWLWFFRGQLRFPRSLLLVPASVILTFLLNSVRIALLILIGHAGARQIAWGGFHSDAGWIFFVGVALGVLFAAKSLWFRRDASADPLAQHDSGLATKRGTFAEENTTAVYLAPLVVILATAMITRAASAEFDWLYPLRFIAAAAVFWAYRRKYFDLDWHFSPESLLLAAAVFLLWIVPLPWRGPPNTNLGATLASLPRWDRDLWVTFRILGAMLTVPVAEELAFRGFALRRLQTVDFESMNWRAFTWPALLISSLIFGIMHGERWIVGTIAGLIYAAAMLRRGRIGDAAIAHATSNALLAAWVITRGAWYLW